VTVSDAEGIHRKSLGLAFRGLGLEFLLVPELFLWIEILSLSITNCPKCSTHYMLKGRV